MIKNKKAQGIEIYLIPTVVFILLIVFLGLLLPVGIQINTELFKSRDLILDVTQKDLDNIDNVEIRNHVNKVIGEGETQGVFIIEFLNDLFQNSAVIIIILVAIVMFLLTRNIVEVSSGGIV